MTTYNNPQRVITVPPTQPSTTFTAFDADFGANEAGELVVRPTQKPWLQWMAGKLTTTTFETPVGWHIQADADPDLDEVLASMNTRCYIVQHPSDDGEPKLVPYWALNYGGKPCSLFVIANGVESTREMEKDHQRRFGIAYAWQVMKDKQGQVIRKKNSTEPKRQCRIQFRAFIHELVAKGDSDWFQVSISGYLTEDILTAFFNQYRVMDAFDSRMRARGSEIIAPFWGFSIPFVPGDSRFVKLKDGGDGTNIIPMVTQIPKRIEDITNQYLNEHRIPKDHQDRIRERLLDDAFVWSSLRSMEMYGDLPMQMQVVAPPIETTASEPASTPLPASRPAPTKDAISATQVKWIKDTCGNNPAIIQSWCEKFQIPDLSHLHSSQFIDLLNLMSQDHQ
jgi:hypothetical protein